jgi:hypothetical protein
LQPVSQKAQLSIELLPFLFIGPQLWQQTQQGVIGLSCIVLISAGRLLIPSPFGDVQERIRDIQIDKKKIDATAIRPFSEEISVGFHLENTGP